MFVENKFVKNIILSNCISQKCCNFQKDVALHYFKYRLGFFYILNDSYINSDIPALKYFGKRNDVAFLQFLKKHQQYFCAMFYLKNY